MPDLRLLADIPEQMDEQEPVLLPGGHGKGTDIQPDDFPGFSARLDIEVTDPTAAAEPLSDSAQG